jgi:3-oxoacyl-[acyl-carrier protein] reductase
MNKDYEDFNIGEIYVFKKTFSQRDFKKFSSLSGDTNPLHHDERYVENTRYKKTIVPLHLAASPLSAIAGVVFPGNRSLYLGHELKALKPIPYDVELTYSAKIIEKTQRDRLLTIRTIVFTKEVVFIEAIQRIKVREDFDSTELLSSNNPANSGFLLPDQAVLITGAAGGIGRNIALKLAQKGRKLVLNFRKKDSRIEKLVTRIKTFGSEYELLELDFSTIGRDLISEKIQNINLNIGAVIHSACPPVHSTLSEHMKVNFESINFVFEELRYTWLSQQFGHIIFISSSATYFHPEGWENYIASKSATENYLKGIQQTHAHYGLRVNVLSLGRVDTEFSRNLDLDTTDALLPEQVAEEVVSITENPKYFYTWLEVNSKKIGTLGFIEHKDNIETSSLIEKKVEYTPTIDLADSLKKFLANYFKESGQIDWNNTGINLLSGWDSLRHIELLMALESEFGIKVTSTEVDQTKNYNGILSLLRNKIIDQKE